MHYYPFHISDFSLSTNHLTLEEEAIYRRLLDYYYHTEAPIPLETQSVTRRLRLGSHLDTVRLILDEFFDKEDDGYHNKRADIEINRYKRRAEIARNNGSKGGRKPRKTTTKTNLEPSGLPDGNPGLTQGQANQEPRTINQEPNIDLGQNEKPRHKTAKFTKPTLEDVREYCRQRGNQVDAEQWYNHYTSNGWRVGKNPMKDWQAAVRTWEKSNGNGQNQQLGQQGRKLSVAERATEHRKRAERLWAEQEANAQSVGEDDTHLRPPLDGEFRRDGGG